MFRSSGGEKSGDPLESAKLSYRRSARQAKDKHRERVKKCFCFHSVIQERNTAEEHLKTKVIDLVVFFSLRRTQISSHIVSFLTKSLITTVKFTRVHHNGLEWLYIYATLYKIQIMIS